MDEARIEHLAFFLSIKSHANSSAYVDSIQNTYTLFSLLLSRGRRALLPCARLAQAAREGIALRRALALRARWLLRRRCGRGHGESRRRRS